MNYDAYETEKSRQTVFNFCLFDTNALAALKSDLSLSLPIEALLLCRDHFRIWERRDPTVGDLRFLDAIASLWQDQPDTAVVDSPTFQASEDARVFSDILRKASALSPTPHHLPFLMDVAGQYLSHCGMPPHYENLRCGHPTELAALYGGNTTALSLELDGTAAMLNAERTPSPFSAKAVCLLFPTGNAPFSDEVAQFFASHRGMGLTPIAAPLGEGLFPHLLKLGGASLDLSFFADYQGDIGAASLLPIGRNAVLFLAPDMALPQLFAERAPFVCCGMQNGTEWLQIHRKGELLLSVSERLLHALRPCRCVHPTVGTHDEKELARALRASSDTALGGITATGGCEQTLLSLIGEMAKRGADLSHATATAALELPPMQNAEAVLSTALPLVLDYHRILSELALPACHHRQIVRKELSEPRLSVFVAAKQQEGRDADFAAKWHSAAEARDFAALRALLYPSI